VSALRAVALGDALGVEVVGWDLSVPASDGDAPSLRQLYDRHHLLLFRQQRLTAEDQVRVCRYLGGVPDPPTLVSNVEPGGFHPEFRLVFHSDYAFLPAPLQGICLYALDMAPGAVPTAFASNAHAARTLPVGLRRRLEGLEATMLANTVSGREDVACRHTSVPDDAPPAVYPSTTRPALWTHPRTGEELVFVNEQHGWRFVGMPRADSDALFDEVFAHLYRPDTVYEHHWAPGDLVVWDNLALQHGRQANPDAVTRSLRRVVLNDVSNEVMVAGTVFEPARWQRHKRDVGRVTGPDDPAPPADEQGGP
jgi:alpha-ketoglutarate-dependent taurine dioxygenase